VAEGLDVSADGRVESALSAASGSDFRLIIERFIRSIADSPPDVAEGSVDETIGRVRPVRFIPSRREATDELDIWDGDTAVCSSDDFKVNTAAWT
jgi:hypothetical protein